MIPTLWVFTCEFFFSFRKNSLIRFQLSGCFQVTPIKSAVTEVDFSKMLCSLHFCPTWTWNNVGWIWISSENIQLQWKLSIYRPLCILTATHDFLGWQSGPQLLTIANSLLFVNTVFPLLLAKQWDQQVAWKKWLGNCEENLRQRLIPKSGRW